MFAHGLPMVGNIVALGWEAHPIPTQSEIAAVQSEEWNKHGGLFTTNCEWSSPQPHKDTIRTQDEVTL